MTQIFQFKQDHEFRERAQLAKQLQTKYPDRVPVIIQFKINSGLGPGLGPRLKETGYAKFLVPVDINFNHLANCVRYDNQINTKQALFFLVNGTTLVTLSTPMSILYEKHRDPDDNFLYIVCQSENTFGYQA